MLTSESVNPTLLPGLIKAIEKYILIYNTQDFITNANLSLKNVVKTGAAGLALGASVVTAYAAMKGAARIKMKGKSLQLEQGNIKVKVVKQQDKPSLTKMAGELGDRVDKAIDKPSSKPAVTGFEMPKYDTVSLEPTWLRVDTPDGPKIIGVKVVPFKVKSTSGMVGLLMDDKSLKKLTYMANKFGRSVMRVFFRAMRGIKIIPGFKYKPITGNIKQDVVWATSQYGKNTFVCFSQLDLEKDDMFTSPTAVQKLHKLGWASMIVTDDVNKQATFCMKQFGGICSTIPYSFIFSSFGKEVHQVYKDIDDASRSAGPFFRKKSTSRAKIFSDARTLAKLEKYSTLRE